MADMTPKHIDDSEEKEVEKSPIEPSDYAGLQVDAEAQSRHIREKLDARPSSIAKPSAFLQPERPFTVMEKGFEAGGLDEESPPAPIYDAPIPTIDSAMKETVRVQNRSRRKDRRICRMRPWKLFMLLAVLLVIVTVAAVVGGVVGSKNAASATTGLSAPSATTSTASTLLPTSDPSIVNAGLPKSDITAGSPLVPVAFNQRVSGSQDPVQTYSLFFQTVQGNVKQCQQGAGPNTDWQSAVPIFTDAHNNSGLAAVTYLNQSQPQTSLFYTGADSTLWEKRLYIGTSVWELGSLTNYHFPVPGNSSFVGDGGWNGFRMAAAYSSHFLTGPGARLFYHGGNATSKWIQELLWHQNNDTWTVGAAIYGADSNSHIAATIEPQSQALRLFYTNGGGAIEEQWTSITANNATYQRGVSIPDALMRATSDVAAISTNDSTYLYYASVPDAAANTSIRELALSPQPNSLASAPPGLAAIPDLLARNTARTVTSAFAPLGAVLSTLNGDEKITVFFAESVVDPKAGYGALKAISRAVNGTWGNVSYGQASGMVEISLGDDNADPS